MQKNIWLCLAVVILKEVFSEVGVDSFSCSLGVALVSNLSCPQACAACRLDQLASSDGARLV